MTRTLLRIAISLLVFMILFQIFRLQGTGVFAADYYYLPLHEFVDPDRHREMEELVIRLYDAADRRWATASLLALGLVLMCVVFADRSLARSISNSAGNG